MGKEGLSLTEKCSALLPQPPLSCWVLWNPIEVLLSPEDTVQIIIGFISAGDVDFLNELTLSSCLSSPFSLMLTHHPLLLLCLTPPRYGPLHPTFFNSGVRALSSRSLFTLGRRNKQRDWSYIASWYCSRASLSIGRAGECIDRVSWRGESEIGWDFLLQCVSLWLASCVQRNVANLPAFDMQMSRAALRHRFESLGNGSTNPRHGCKCAIKHTEVNILQRLWTNTELNLVWGAF